MEWRNDGLPKKIFIFGLELIANLPIFQHSIIPEGLMFLTVNGEKYEHGGDGTVPALLAELGATPEHTAVTVNGELVRCHSLRSLPRNTEASLASLGSKDWTRAAGESAFGISKRSDPKGSGNIFKLNDGDAVEVLTFVGGG